MELLETDSSENKEWTIDYLNEEKCVSLGDLDGDSKADVVTSGVVASAGSFSSTQLFLKGRNFVFGGGTEKH